MTTFEKNVKAISDEIYKNNVQQILIDLVQETIEDLFNPDDPLTSEDIGAAHYDADILLEVFNPVFETDVSILKRLVKALNEWQKDFEANNKILGLPPCG